MILRSTNLRCLLKLAGPRLTITGPKIMLTPQVAQAIGLALHELGTNAIKHGAWSVPSGNVSIAGHLMHIQTARVFCK